MLAGEQQTAVTVAMEGLMDAKPPPELESFATFDPRVGFIWQDCHGLLQVGVCCAAAHPPVRQLLTASSHCGWQAMTC